MIESFKKTKVKKIRNMTLIILTHFILLTSIVDKQLLFTAVYVVKPKLATINKRLQSLSHKYNYFPMNPVSHKQ